MPNTQKRLLLDLAKRIKSARESARLSQQELGNHIGVSDKSISAYEKGRSIPPVEKLQKIADLTAHPLTYFTDQNANEALITSKLATVEKELAEIKKLLKKAAK
jgi:transcriptional regulator with XRE-family HTH domain